MIPLTLTFGKDQEVIIDYILETMNARVTFSKVGGTLGGTAVTYDMEFLTANDIYVFGHAQASKKLTDIISLYNKVNTRIGQ